MPRLKALPSLVSEVLPKVAPSPARHGGVADSGKSLRHLYATKRWRDLKRQCLKRHRYRCEKTGVLLQGKYPAPDSPVLDHIEPHRGDLAKFWDVENLQVVSKAYHDGEKQRMELRTDGWG